MVIEKIAQLCHNNMYTGKSDSFKSNINLKLSFFKGSSLSLLPWKNTLWSVKDIYDEEERSIACRNKTHLNQYFHYVQTEKYQADGNIALYY